MIRLMQKLKNAFKHSKNNLTIKNSTYKDIALNQAQSKEHWNEEIQQLQQQEKFTQIENLIYHLK